MVSSPNFTSNRRLLWLLALAAVLRLVIGLDVWAHDPTASALLSDSLYYRDWATALSGGAAFPHEGARLAYWMPPLYAHILSWLAASTAAMLIVQAAAGLVTTLLVVRIGEALFEGEPSARTAALAGGLIWTLYGPVIFFEGRLLGATFATLLAALALLSALAWRKSARPQQLIILGLALGLLSLIRPNTLLAIPALGAWLLWIARREPSKLAGLRHVAWMLAPALLALSPATVHNLRATGSLVPVTVNGGVNFYFGNNPESHGTFHAPGIEWGAITAQRETARLGAASGLALPAASVDDPRASRFWFGRGLDFLTDEPAAALKLYGLKAADLVSSTEFGIQYNFSAARTRAPSLWLVSLPFGLVLALAALGLRRRHAPLLLAWLGAGALSALLYFTYSRFRLPLLPILIPFAGLGLVRLLNRAATAKSLTVAAALLALSFIPFEGTYPRHLKSHALADMAAALPSEPATRAERTELLDAALALVPGNKPALTSRALLALEARDPKLALAKLEAAAALAVDYPTAEFELARLLATTPDTSRRDPARAAQIVSDWLASHAADHPAAPSFQQLAQALAGNL